MGEITATQEAYIRKCREAGMRITEIAELLRLPYSKVNNKVQRINRGLPDWDSRPQKDNGYQSDKDIRRDDYTLAIYLALRCDAGIVPTTDEALAVLTYLAKGNLAEERDDGLWYRPAKWHEPGFGWWREHDEREDD